MQHVNMSEYFLFSETPFPAFRVESVFGRNKRDHSFLPTKIAPLQEHRVAAYRSMGDLVLYTGRDRAAADAAALEHNSANPSSRAVVTSSAPVLPTGQFRIIKTRDKGTILVVPGADDSRRCLLFVSCKGGFRGGVSISSGDTDGQVIMECSAGNACDSRVDAAAILDVGQRVVFHATGRRCNEYISYAWDGARIDRSVVPAEEWRARAEVAAAEGDAL